MKTEFLGHRPAPTVSLQGPESDHIDSRCPRRQRVAPTRELTFGLFQIAPTWLASWIRLPAATLRHRGCNQVGN